MTQRAEAEKEEENKKIIFHWRLKATKLGKLLVNFSTIHQGLKAFVIKNCHENH